MTWPVSIPSGKINLFVRGRIDESDAKRQTDTAIAVLRKLERQPGLVLADEVGMGKTFVALTVAVSAAWADEQQRPVVIMVPAGLKQKWPRDFQVFCDRCILNTGDRDLQWAEASNGLEFFRLLSRPARRRPRLIFLTHGALNRNLDDPWVKFAVLKAAMRGRHLGVRRDSLPRFAAAILQLKSKYSNEDLYRTLLRAEVSDWNGIIDQYGRPLEEAAVPPALVNAIERAEADLRALGDLLHQLPVRATNNIDERIVQIRHALNAAFQGIWRQALKEAQFRSPLVVLDEAHHLKNPQTDLASLFVTADSEADAKELSGALDGGFERMLFLTATPFQLGHHELMNVLGRFSGVNWKALPGSKADFLSQLHELRRVLDAAQYEALALDEQWARLRPEDITGEDVDAWWERVNRSPLTQAERVQAVIRAFERTDAALRDAEAQLSPWVVRHLRPRLLPGSETERRVRLPGDGLLADKAGDGSGLPIVERALLPFLLAARAQALVATIAREMHDVGAYRATFAEGLASSFEAYLETRRRGHHELEDEAQEGVAANDPRLRRYLTRLTDSLPSKAAFAQHPKVSAVVDRVAKLWEQGEKVVVFCHYRVTGRVLVSHISDAIRSRLRHIASEQAKRAGTDTRTMLKAWDRAFARDASLDRALRDIVMPKLTRAGLEAGEQQRVVDVVRRFVRTPLFLVRNVQLDANDRTDGLRRAFSQRAGTGSDLGLRLDQFLAFMSERCTPGERAEYLEALERIQPGTNFEQHLAVEHHRGSALLPTVRLASGSVPTDVRRRLLLGFNTPFLPEVLVASSVMAEGVDLHLNCRHIIHHDLSWNPSTIEQRTGRIDRIGAKAEKVQQSIRVYMPYVEGTQDEKMYRVVMDRERWFQVVMGEKYRIDELTTTKLAERVPLPEAVCRRLALRLEASDHVR